MDIKTLIFPVPRLGVADQITFSGFCRRRKDLAACNRLFSAAIEPRPAQESHWDAIGIKYATKRINHSEAYSMDGACTNQAESFFSRIRRAEMGVHHHIAGRYLDSYANEMAWRENNCRVLNSVQFMAIVGVALDHPVSRQWKGYWQRGN